MLVIPGLPADFSRAEPGICFLEAQPADKDEIPGSIASKAGNGPGMTK